MKKTLKKSLQIRFVLLSMAVLLLLQGAIVGFSIWHSYRDMVSKSDVLISQLQKNPSAGSRYFSVKVHPGKGSVRIDTVQNVSVTPAQAGEYAKAVIHNDADRGFIDGYRYHIYTNTEGIRILFLSRQSSLEMHRSTCKSLILFSLGGLAIMCVVLILLSGAVVAPIVENHNKQKQFITAAGHQLKTPLTVIRTDAQMLQEEIGNSQWLDGILAQTDRLTQMTNDLVSLSRSEEYSNSLVTEVFSLSDAINEISGFYEVIAKRNDVALHASTPEALSYRGNPEEIRQLVSILLDNATKYCTPGGQIALTTKKELRGISIQIENTASELENASDSMFTQRFFRGDNAAGKEGSGLGLTIAESIAHRHGGKLTVAAKKDSFCVYVMLH
ncbi:MAG: HAMP domain-containing histidine kinase [Oscillospiraceae bacterium]|nr:HAMP domain-containing histidine kinase [Oscillospiraceae bacterium]